MKRHPFDGQNKAKRFTGQTNEGKNSASILGVNLIVTHTTTFTSGSIDRSKLFKITKQISTFAFLLCSFIYVYPK